MNQEQIEKITTLKEKIKSLPKGYISFKVIGDHVYCYHQWSENGCKYSKYISDEELPKLNSLIALRKELEEELKLLKKGTDASSVLLCSLMHLNNVVLDLYIDKDSGYIKRISDVYLNEHLPLGTANKDGSVNEKALSEWWNERAIPLSRSGIREAFDKLNISTPQSLLIHCHGLSLSDQYWIKPVKADVIWEEVNFFTNDFSEDIGEILFGGNKKNDDIDLSSPDNTSIGNLKKKWKIANHKRILIKGGSNPFRQEPYNEVIASLVLKELDIPYVDYSLTYIDGYPYCECEDFIQQNEDLITAFQINKVLIKNNNDSAYAHFLKCCEYLNIHHASEYLDKLLVFDFIIANEDRHFNNFGFVRNAKTLEFIGPAPIFDSGSSFGFDKITDEIRPFAFIESKPFKNKFLEQIQLVQSFDWLTIDKLDNIKELLNNEFYQYESKYLDKDRIAAIISSAFERIEYLKNIIKTSPIIK